MSAPKRKAVGGYHTTTTAIKIHTVNVAPGQKKRHTALKCCARIHAGAQNTTDNAGNLPDSEVFSRPEFKVLGVGIAYPQGRQHGVIHVLNPHTHPECLKSARDGFQSHNGAKTMTKVNTPATSTLDTIARQQAIENALTTALYFIRLPGTPSALHAATGRANRALTLLKHACSEAQTTQGRA